MPNQECRRTVERVTHSKLDMPEILKHELWELHNNLRHMSRVRSDYLPNVFPIHAQEQKRSIIEILRHDEKPNSLLSLKGCRCCPVVNVMEHLLQLLYSARIPGARFAGIFQQLNCMLMRRHTSNIQRSAPSAILHRNRGTHIQEKTDSHV